MPTLSLTHPLALDRPDPVARIRDVLLQAGYTGPSVGRLLGTGDPPATKQILESLPLHHRRTRGESPLEILVRLFLLRQSVVPDIASLALAPAPLDEWAAVGLLRVEPAEV